MSDFTEEEIAYVMAKADELYPESEWCKCAQLTKEMGRELIVYPMSSFKMIIMGCACGINHKYVFLTRYNGIFEKIRTYFDYYLSKIF